MRFCGTLSSPATASHYIHAYTFSLLFKQDEFTLTVTQSRRQYYGQNNNVDTHLLTYPNE